MVNAYVHYVTWISRRRRHHGSASVDIVPPPPPSVLSPGDIFQAPWAAPAISWVDSSGSHNASFAFWSIRGGIEGALATTANTPPTVTVGNTDIVATAWYIAGNGNGIGILIDAFDIDLGDFVDDDFVKIAPDSNLEKAANEDGFVPTTSEETIKAYQSIHSSAFSEWVVIAGTETVNQQDLLVQAQSSAIAFAFYQSGPPIVIGRLREPITIPGPISIGYQAIVWQKYHERIGELIKEWGLRPMPAETERTYSVRTPISAGESRVTTVKSPMQLRCGLRVPHLHYEGKTYLLKTDQWNIFANTVQKELSKKLADAKSVTFNKLIEVSEAVGELP